MKEVERPRPLTWRHRVLARIIAMIVRCICATVQLTFEGAAADYTATPEHGGALFVTWHGRTLIPVDYFRGRGRWGYHMLVSLSRDGDLVSAYFEASGLNVIRGSTKRRGVTAAREALTLLENKAILAMTPDGPRGPAEIAQPGVVYFALKSGKPIIPAGIAAWPRWEMNSWDRYMVPKPFAKAHWVYGDPIFVRPGDDLEDSVRHLSDVLNQLQAQAESAVQPRQSFAQMSSRHPLDDR
jgi:lysophospholipid acyltransferase (LPLAT)-like uncharacterized protein